MDISRSCFVPTHALSRRLGLPATWLKREALAGRIPFLRAGRKLMFNPEVVERLLIDRACQQVDTGKGAEHG